MARKPDNTPPVEVRAFTLPEIDVGIAKLRRRIEEVRGLESSAVCFDDACVRTAEANIRDAIRDVFGANSSESRDHQYHDIWRGGYNMLDSEATRQQKFVDGIPQTVSMLEGLIARLEEKRVDLAQAAGPGPDPSGSAPAEITRRVFVVHGRDEEAKHTTARFLQILKLDPIVLGEQPDEGRTLIEKFEQCSDVSYAVVLLTPDDIGHAKDQPDAPSPRARQNVVLELGYFLGKLTRKRVCALRKGSVEIPSDYHGVMYIPTDDAGGWKLQLARELKNAGLKVDLDQAIQSNAG